jgi:hypothetical protein
VYGSWRTKSPYTRYSERNCLSVEPLYTRPLTARGNGAGLEIYTCITS